jgi:predicted Fe-Mo cluster-binding NifX family protein
MGPVLIARFGYRHEAELAMGFLEDAGIDAVLVADDAGGAGVGLTISNLARILVAPERAEEARGVLESAGIEVVRS